MIPGRLDQGLGNAGIHRLTLWMGWGAGNEAAPRMTGTDVDQYADPRARLSLRHRTQRFGAKLATTDGRWALVSSSLTILVAGAIGWMAMGTLPQAPAVRPNHTALPYELFLRLVQAGGAQQLAAIAPQFAPPTQDQQAAQSVSDVESRTLQLDSGDTLAGAMEDAGVSTADANAAITALGKDFNP